MLCNKDINVAQYIYKIKTIFETYTGAQINIKDIKMPKKIKSNNKILKSIIGYYIYVYKNIYVIYSKYHYFIYDLKNKLIYFYKNSLTFITHNGLYDINYYQLYKKYVIKKQINKLKFDNKLIYIFVIYVKYILYIWAFFCGENNIN
jgi:hypothetical protein